MNLHRSKAARAAASVAALAVLIGPSAAGAWAQEATPEPTPEATTTDDHADQKHKPTIPKTNTFALGQSMQIRVNADGEQNAKLVNFRWSVSHLTIQGPPDGSQDGEYVVPVPEGGTLPRYLENFGFIHVENGYGEWDMNVENGWDTQRSVSIFPQDATPNISLKTEFTLDGEPVKAQDIVGKDGLVTATYTLINNTTKPFDLVVKDINGADVATTAEGDSPMVAITKTLLPQRYIGLNTGAGIFGADGRGNNQVQWISLPFKPLAENSQASFGWAAYVTDAVVPSLLTQVSPLYIPAHDATTESTAEDSEGESTSTPIPLDPAIAEIQAGLANVVAGLESIAATKDPAETCTLGDGTTTTDPLLCLQDGINDKIDAIPGKLEAQQADNSAMITLYDKTADALTTYTATPTSPDDSGVVALLAEFDSGPYCESFTQASTLEKCGEVEALLNDLTPGGANGAAIAAQQAQALAFLNANIPLGQAILSGTNEILSALAGKAASAPDITGVPSVDAIVEGIKTDLATRSGGLVGAGMDQVSSGVAQAKGIIAAYVSDLAAQIQTAVASGVASANDALIHIRGEIGALKAAAAESPLIYGPLPPGTPEGTVLAGAYEFRIDAADTNHPYTLPRILVGLIALIAAGFVVKYLGNRNTVA